MLVRLIATIQLHASDLRSLAPSSSLVRAINAAPSSVEFPYMQGNIEDLLLELTNAISQRCGSRIISGSAQEIQPHLDGSERAGKKHVVCVGMPPMEGAAGYRKTLMAEHGTLPYASSM